MSETQVEDKARDLIAPVLGEVRGPKRSIDAVRDVEALDDLIAELRALMDTGSGHIETAGDVHRLPGHEASVGKAHADDHAGGFLDIALAAERDR